MPTFATTSIRRDSLRDQALAMIRQALITGQIAPGVVYSATALAAELGVSTSPVREAMLSLVDDGLMESVPNRGYRAVTLTGHDMAEIHQLRMLLEVAGAGQAAERDLGDRLAELTALVDTIERTAADGDVAANLEADRQFHLTLVAAGGNQRLTRMVARLRDQTRLYNLRNLAATGELVSSAAEHRPLLAAVADHDRDTAESLMRGHLAHLRGDWSTAT
jgi:DNA-binding GntR family transcriptional regulator